MRNMPHLTSRLAMALCAAALACLGACSNDDVAAKLGSAGAGAARADVTSGLADSAAGGGSDVEGADTPQATCTGSALVSGFAAKDPECSFLSKCPTLGKCYCGDKCSADKPKCDPSLCPSASPKCFCGEACSQEGKTPLCPESVCAGYQGVACIEKDACTYVNKEPPSWCGCQKMDPIKKCWCNAGLCSEPREECPPAKCVGKPTDKCILVPGEQPTTCWCDTCGLVGETPKCFFVLCPGS